MKQSAITHGTVRPAATAGDRPATWAPGVSHAQRKRLTLQVIQTLGTVWVAVLAVLGAYLLTYGWPASLGTVRESPYSVWPVFTGLLRMAAAPEFSRYVPLLLFAPLLAVYVYRWFRLYHHSPLVLSPFGDTNTILKGAAMTTGGLVLLGTAFPGIQSGQDQLFAVFYYGFVFVILAAGMVLFHSGVLIVRMTLRTYNIGHTRAAVVVREGDAAELTRLFDTPSSEYRFVGLIATDSRAGVPKSLGTIDTLEDLINGHNIDELILAADPAELSADQRWRIALSCWKLGVDLKIVTPFHPFFHTSGQPQLFGHIPLLSVERVGLYTTWSQAAKRAMDIAVSATALTLLSPLLLLVATLIKLESPGAVLFLQERPGLHGRVFRILKFRSMYADADSTPHREAQRKLIREGRAAERIGAGKAVYGKVAKDPRITKVGRIIRRTSIDELPQLFNVLRGEMSLVGPRPSVLYELENYTDRHRLRLNIRPGITGLWQVSGRSLLSFEQMVELDIHYIEKWSLWLDIKILLRTIPVVFNIRQAY